eukprot:1690127-Pyramimonas_sp.AAC.2
MCEIAGAGGCSRKPQAYALVAPPLPSQHIRHSTRQCREALDPRATFHGTLSQPPRRHGEAREHGVCTPPRNRLLPASGILVIKT